jgi:hypothetical protein
MTGAGYSSDAAAWLAKLNWKGKPTGADVDALIAARVVNAYDAALAKLSRQYATLLSLRSQSNGIVTVAVLVTSLSVGLGFIKAGASGSPAFPDWARWTLLGIVPAIVGLHIAIGWPVKRIFGANPEALLGVGENPPEGPIRKSHVQELIECGRKNAGWITISARLYQVQSICLLAEVIVVIIATLRE